MEAGPRERDFDPGGDHSVPEEGSRLKSEQERAEKGVGEPFLEVKNPQKDGAPRPTATLPGSYPEWPECYSARQ